MEKGEDFKNRLIRPTYVFRGAYSSPLGWDAPYWGGGPDPGTSTVDLCRSGDFNGDGKADIACYTTANGSWHLALSTGNGWNASYWGGGPDPGIPIGKQCIAGDFNGDGKADIACYTTANSSWHLALSAGDFPDLLTNISNGIGGTTTLSYLPSSSYDNCIDIDGKNVCLPFVVQTVSSISVNDGNGNISATNYIYSGGFFDAEDRDFRGFDYVKATDPAGTSTETWFIQEDTLKGLPEIQVIYDSSELVYTATQLYYEVNPDVNFPYLKQKDEYVFDRSATWDDLYLSDAWKSKPQIHTQTIFEYDDYGNIKRKNSKGDISVTGDERDEYTTYTHELPEYSSLTAKWMVSLPYTTYIRDSAGVIKARTWFGYDTNTGNLWIKTTCLSNTAPYDVCSQSVPDTNDPFTEYIYYTNGNLWKVYDPKRYLTTYEEYDSATQTYATKITNALNQSVTKTYDYRFGKPLTETDPNNNTTTYVYDPFGRVENVIDPSSGAPAYAWKETYYDGLGRTIMAKTGGPDGKVIVAETGYNNRGLIEYTSLPYFEGIETPRWAYYQYDPIGRMTKITHPDSTYVTKSYMQGRTTIIDAEGHQKVEEKDVYGRLVKVEEYTGTYPSFTLYATTTYKYNVLGNLIEVKDAKNNLTTINYDTLSRKKNMNDPDMGYWEYDYDKNGNLIWQKDAKGQIIQFQYDALNRITLKDYPTGTDVNYYYDQPYGQSCLDNNFTGRLSKVTDASGEEKYCYDEVGRGDKAIKTVDGVDYTTETTYDELGRVDSIRYPDQSVVNYVYDDGGNLRQVPGYATYGGYSALGQVGSVTYGNNVTTLYQYYSTNNRLYSITTNSPSQGLQNLSYTYYNGGSIMGITDYINSTRSQTFTYDEINRLRFATSTVYGTLEYRYDEIGNISYNSQVGSYTYWKQVYGTKPHAVYQAGANIYGYDANGNMTSSPGKTLTYDYDNRPTSINGTSFVYDYSGQRVKKNSTIYIGKLYECTGGSCTKYIFAGSNRIAYKIGSATNYYHTDHLGSSSIITNASGSKVNELYYYPYGKTRYALDSSLTHKFTGQEEDEETGLYYYGARYYDPAIGRFVSADSIVPDFSDPQSLNRYSYCRNNPIIMTDPSGHFWWFVAGAIVGAISAGAQSDWNLQAMVTGAVIGGISAGVFSGVEGAVAGAIQNSVTNATVAGAISGAAGGAAAGATAGGLGAAIYGGNVLRSMLIGAGTGAVIGGVMGAITGPSKSAQYRGQAIEDDPLYFDGKQLRATDSQGNVIDAWQATSGEPGSTTSLVDQSRVGYGPIPEGNYSVNPSNIQRWSDLSWYQKVAAYFNRGEWPGGVPAWGHFRAQIDIPGGSILGRDGFFIHGGWFEGSAGCIDLGANADSFFRYLSVQQNPIPLTVKY